MTLEQLFPSAVGGITGFLLAQLVNAIALTHRWWVKPRLQIELVGHDHVLLDHRAEQPNGESYHEVICGFRVRNTGSRAALGVLSHLLKLEIRDESTEPFREVLVHTFTLPWSDVKPDKSARDPLILVPGASATVRLAEWREDHDVLAPCTLGFGEYYEEGCQGAKQFRFTVAAVTASGEHGTATIAINNPPRKR